MPPPSLRRTRFFLRWVVLPMLALLMVFLQWHSTTYHLSHTKAVPVVDLTSPSTTEQHSSNVHKLEVSQLRASFQSQSLSRQLSSTAQKRQENYLKRYNQAHTANKSMSHAETQQLRNLENAQRTHNLQEWHEQRLQHPDKYLVPRNTHPPKHRQRPTQPVVFLVHIHKSAGSLMCQLAQFNNLTINQKYNCNIQRNQRCCGNNDTKEAQTNFAQTTPFDLVAAEMPLYQGLDFQAYNYIVILRQSKERYFSHWKHIVRESRPDRASAQRKQQAALMKSRNQNAPSAVTANAEKKTINQQALQEQREQPQQNNIPKKTLVQAIKEPQTNKNGLRLTVLNNPRQALKNLREKALQEKQKTAAERAMENHRRLEEQREDSPANKQQWSSPSEDTPQDDNNHENSHADTEGHETNDNSNSNQNSNTDAEENTEEHDIRNNPHRASPSEDTTSHVNQNAYAGPQDNRHHKPSATKKALSKLHKFYKKRQRHAPVFRGMAHPSQHHLDSHRAKKLGAPLVFSNFSQWWQLQPDNWNTRQLCGTHCHGTPKYALELKDHWEYTLQRMSQFHTILFQEELQASVEVLTTRLNWPLSNLTRIQDMAHAGDARKTKRRLDSGLGTNRTRVPRPTKKMINPPVPARSQLEDWDPLMSALDDALYEIAHHWEHQKQEGAEVKVEGWKDWLKPQTRQILERYFEEGPRHQCTNECCAVLCSKW